MAALFLYFLGLHHKSPRGRRDNVETIDMEMSDDDFADFEDLAEGKLCKQIILSFHISPATFIFCFTVTDLLDTPEDLIAGGENSKESAEPIAKPNQENLDRNVDAAPNEEDSEEIDHDDRQQQHQNFESNDINHRHQPQPQFHQQYPDNQFRSPLFNTPPPNFANNNIRMPGNNNYPNRFWNNNSNQQQQQTGTNNFSPRQWNSPQNFRPGGNMNMQRPPQQHHQIRGNIPQMMGGNFNSPQNLGGNTFNAGVPSPHTTPMHGGGNFNKMQNLGGNTFNNATRFNTPQNINSIRSQMGGSRFSVQQHPQPLMSIVTQNEIEEGVDGPIIAEHEELLSPSQLHPSIDDNSCVGGGVDNITNDCADSDKADDVSSQKGSGDTEGGNESLCGDVDMRVKPIGINNVDDDQKSNSGAIGDHSNDSSYSAANSVGSGKQTNLDSSAEQQSTPVAAAKPARKPNPFSKQPSVGAPRSLLDLPTTPILPVAPFNNSDILSVSNNNQFSSPQQMMMMDNGGGGNGGMNMRGGGQQQFFSPQQQQHSMPFSPNQMRGGGNGSPYFRQNRGGAIGGPGRPPYGGKNRGGVGSGGGGMMGRGGRGNFRGNW